VSAATPASLAVSCTTECVWKITGVPEAIQPLGLAVDSHGNLYVTDNKAGRILKFDPDGILITQWGKQGPQEGKLNTPWALAIDSQDNVYVIDVALGDVLVYDQNGQFLHKGTPQAPTELAFQYGNGVAIDAKGYVYFTDYINDRVLKFDGLKTFIAAWGDRGKGQLRDPVGIAIDHGGNVYVADSGNGRVVKFDSNGKFLAQIANCGSRTPASIFPVNLAIDAQDNLYVADSGASRICKYDQNGKFVGLWGTKGTGDGQFGGSDPAISMYSPTAIAIDAQGNVYVSDALINRIMKFKPR
jgi:DNA-binding beta-propeller fold protein YncE